MNYNPAEDTFLLLDSLPPGMNRVLEIGCGGGFILRNYKKDSGGLYVGCDLRRGGVDIICDGRLLPFRDDSFDLIFFNPPYLPSEKYTDITVDGGNKGIEMAVKFMNESKRCLVDDGRMYVLLSTISNINEFLEIARTNGMKSEEVSRKRMFMEELVVLELTKG